MADTVDTGLLPRTYFKAPRVPFDFRALALAMLGYLVYWGGSLLLNQIFKDEAHQTLKDPNIVGSFLASANLIFEGIPFLNQVIPEFLGRVFLAGELRGFPLSEYSIWHKLAGGVWIFVVWSFFGQAIHRITSLRIARDEGLSFAEAFRFAAKNWTTIILAPVIIGVTIAFFYFCNAAAGAIIAIPYAGQILALILIPLAMISALLILLIALGGILGLPLIGAAAAWERNGSLDAISRAFSYIFARPLQFFWNYFLIFLFVGVILLVGSWFISVLTNSVDFGIWDTKLSMLVDPPLRNEISGDLETDYTDLQASTEYVNGRDSNGNPWAMHWDAVPKGGLSQGLNVILFWLAINLIWIGVFGYAIYWFLGATTSVYADLRADVDGTEEDEIYIEEEEEDFDALAEAASQAEPDPTPAPAPETSAPESTPQEAPKDAPTAGEGGSAAADPGTDAPDAPDKTGPDGDEGGEKPPSGDAS